MLAKDAKSDLEKLKDPHSPTGYVLKQHDMDKIA